VRKSANVEKRRCHVARAAFNINGAKDGYTGRPTTALHRAPSRRSPSQPSHDVLSERCQFSPQEQAAIRFAVNLVQGKWKIGILCRLQEGPARLGELSRLFPEASKKMLIQHLRQMEWDGLIGRRDTSGKVPHVEYSLLEPRGVALSRLLHFLAEWSMEYPARGSDTRENSSPILASGIRDQASA
jgi:DNA-binding HxlR family transcriptional regulator